MERTGGLLVLTARLLTGELGGLPGSAGGGTAAGDTAITASAEPDAALPSPLPWSALSAALFTAAALFTSALIVLTNLLVAVSMARCQQRLQTAGSSLLLALSLTDGLLGLALPTALLLPPPAPAGPLRLLPAAVVVALCVSSVLTTAAIAGDRCASLVWPLRYTTLVTRRGVARCVAAVWMCGLLAGAGLTFGNSPYASEGAVSSSSSSDGDSGSSSGSSISKSSSSSSNVVCALDLPERSLAAVVAGAVFVPASSIILCSCMYVYCVARTHVKAIRTVEASLGVRGSGSSAGCGPLLLLVVLAFLVCWGPLAAGAVLRAGWLYCGGPTRDWLLLLAVSSAAANPFLYSLNSAKMQLGCKKLLRAMMARLGVGRQAQNTTVTLRMGSGVRHRAETVNQSCAATPLPPTVTVLATSREAVSIACTVNVRGPATAV